MRPTIALLPQTFIRKLIVQHNGCLTYDGALNRGYGEFWAGKPVRAHRFAYELWVGPIPPELTLDHLCHDSTLCIGGPTCPHRACVRPEHLTAIPRGDNARRALRTGWCKSGRHLLAGENLVSRRDGRVECRPCSNERRRISRMTDIIGSTT